MSTTLTADLLQDTIAMSVANAMILANKKATELGINIVNSIITITQQSLDDNRLWRVNYGPKDYINVRGGDLMIDVNADSGSIEQVLWGQ